MLPLHAVPSWCTLSVSTSAVLDVFSLGSHSSLQPRALLWSGDQGSGARSCLCHVEELMLPSWAGTSGHASQQDEEEFRIQILFSPAGSWQQEEAWCLF